MSLGFMGAHLKCHMGDSKYMSSVFAPDLIISRVLYNSLNENNATTGRCSPDRDAKAH